MNKVVNYKVNQSEDQLKIRFKMQTNLNRNLIEKSAKKRFVHDAYGQNQTGTGHVYEDAGGGAAAYKSVDYKTRSFSDFPTIINRSSQAITPILSAKGGRSHQ